MSRRARAAVAVSVVIPACDEAALLPDLIRRTARTLERAAASFEVVVCDDASTDGTPSVLENLSRLEPRLVVRRRARRGGRQVALREGLQLARGTAIVTMCPGCGVVPEQVTALLEGIKRGADVVSGRRVRHGLCTFQRLAGWLRRAVLGALSGLPGRDWGSSFRAYRRHALAALLRGPESSFMLPDLLDLQGFRSLRVQVAGEPGGRAVPSEDDAAFLGQRLAESAAAVIRQRIARRRAAPAVLLPERSNAAT
ncbi:MAG: glycosyltransferase family 2 protein [Planctomycetes bacterium]|nr:glycosyltransferase family 2 protein [Planctomycetota bacterium]